MVFIAEETDTFLHHTQLCVRMREYVYIYECMCVGGMIISNYTCVRVCLYVYMWHM